MLGLPVLLRGPSSGAETAIGTADPNADLPFATRRAVLRQAYMLGNIDAAEFERQLDTLLLPRARPREFGAIITPEAAAVLRETLRAEFERGGNVERIQVLGGGCEYVETAGDDLTGPTSSDLLKKYRNHPFL